MNSWAGMNLAVRNVTGKDPDAYLSDYRNRNNMKMQELKEAVGVESRTTILNPTYIKEKMKGGASAASEVAQTVTNTYGWNVMKPAAIDKELWDNIYDVYVKDEYKLNVKDFFEKQNPAALQEVTAVMMETARKGYWKSFSGTTLQYCQTAYRPCQTIRSFGQRIYRRQCQITAVHRLSSRCANRSQLQQGTETNETSHPGRRSDQRRHGIEETIERCRTRGTGRTKFFEWRPYRRYCSGSICCHVANT